MCKLWCDTKHKINKQSLSFFHIVCCDNSLVVMGLWGWHRPGPSKVGPAGQIWPSMILFLALQRVPENDRFSVLVQFNISLVI